MSTKPMITGTTHPLPFERLSPADFERLVLWLAEAEGFTKVQHYGLVGSDGGWDIVGVKPDDGRYWVFQAKRRASLTLAEIEIEINKIASQSSRSTDQPVAGIIFVVPCPVSAKTRRAAVAHAASRGLGLEFWAQTELDFRTKRHNALLTEFFQSYTGIQAVDLRDEIADLLYSRMQIRMSDLEHVEAFRKLGPILSRSDAYDETTVRLVWNLVHHVSITRKHEVWRRLALQSDAAFLVSDLAPLQGDTASWFKDPAYRGTDQLTQRLAADIARRKRGRSDRKAGVFKRIFVDRTRNVLDRDGELFLRLLRRQTRSKIDLYVLEDHDLPRSVQERPHEVTIVGDVATTFQQNAFTTYIVPLANVDEARDHYSELERHAIPACDYIKHLSQLPRESNAL